MPVTHAATKRWTVDEYLKIFDMGVLDRSERVELIEGEIVTLSPQGNPHYVSVVHANSVLVNAFPPSHYVAPAVDVHISPTSAPEPDFIVIEKGEFDRADRLTRADLFIEISNTSLRYDRNEKASVYAKAGIAEYWIVNVRQRQLEVHRDPGVDDKAPYGHAYRDVRILKPADVVRPLCRPDVEIQVGSLL